jgi:hypothetical protein
MTKSNRFGNISVAWMFVVMELVLNPMISAKAAIVEQHDKPWQMVSYSVTGTTAEASGHRA